MGLPDNFPEHRSLHPSFMHLHQAREKKTGKLVALKMIKMEKEREGFPVTSIREINVLLNFHHLNIVPVWEIVVNPK